MSDFLAQIERDGFSVIENVVDAKVVERLVNVLSATATGDHVVQRRAGSLYAVRDLLRQSPEVTALCRSSAMRHLVEPVLGKSAVAVRGILFDKTDGANWKVAWHQDLSIAVREKKDTEGYGPWSVKAGVPHVQPPCDVLRRMLTVRLHLDDCNETNSPLRVVPGSHRCGVMNAQMVDQCRERGPIVECHVPAGGALVMRPMLLHASSPAKEPRHRRVIHIEYAGGVLDSGLEWFDALH